eukprot:TRINITY_DN1156_c0_g1_i1.p2 TRINITY_DN1156_c0_g1~~TRINITY_DN1156_c0_g1_i1.p2  ORF type:complete len:401 (-),score=150.84 TRINITY_DN1156_c0_g1_i1:87-1199(-)
MKLWLVVLAAAGIAAAATPCGQVPSDPYMNNDAIQLMCFLRNHTYISGQTDVKDAEYVYSFTGRYPAIVAFDFYSCTDNNDAACGTPSEVYNWVHTTANGKKVLGGIVAIQWHWKCPYGGDYYTYPCNFPPDLNNPNSKLYKDIDWIVYNLKLIQDNGIPVLFRPLHESNNNYMWWARYGQSNYIALWKLIFARAALQNVHNVVWNFNGMASGQGTSLDSWYPGDSYADEVSSDYYQSWSDYNYMNGIWGTKKIIAIAETFNELDPASEPPFSDSVTWASRDWHSDTYGDWKIAMANGKTITIDQLPDLDNTGQQSTDNTCCDYYPYSDGYSCAQQASWGKCGESWMASPVCDCSCKRCTPPTGMCLVCV